MRATGGVLPARSRSRSRSHRPLPRPPPAPESLAGFERRWWGAGLVPKLYQRLRAARNGIVSRKDSGTGVATSAAADRWSGLAKPSDRGDPTCRRYLTRLALASGVGRYMPTAWGVCRTVAARDARLPVTLPVTFNPREQLATRRTGEQIRSGRPILSTSGGCGWSAISAGGRIGLARCARSGTVAASCTPLRVRDRSASRAPMSSAHVAAGGAGSGAVVAGGTSPSAAISLRSARGALVAIGGDGAGGSRARCGRTIARPWGRGGVIARGCGRGST